MTSLARYARCCRGPYRRLQPLTVRNDDRPETIRNRLALYREQTAPLLRHYRSLVQHVPSPNSDVRSPWLRGC
jgi:adenylate kinase family enzyme